MGHSYWGSSVITSAYAGSTNIVKIRKGADEVWRYEVPVPAGAIIIYTGDVSAIPAGYVLCNGSGGTPDLRERFILGTKSTPPGTSGGATTHNHDLSAAASHNHDGVTASADHFHWLTSVGTGGELRSGAVGYTFQLANADTHNHDVSASTGGLHGHGVGPNNTANGLAAGSNMPPYYVVAFIMKS